MALQQLNTVTSRGLVDMLALAAKSDVALYIHGSFGLGKSAIVRQAMARMGRGVVEERLSQVAPEDAGILLPRPETGDVIRTMPDVVRRVHAADGPQCLFLDEFNSASGMTQAAFGYELLLDRSLSGFKLKPGTAVVAAGNLATDRGIVTRLPSPAANRVAHVLFSGPTIDEWLDDYAIPAGVNPLLVAALKEAPVYLCGKADPSADRTPTPRSWEMAGKLLEALPPSATTTMQLMVVSACVGDDAALKVKTILDLVGGLPAWEELLTGGAASAKVPTAVAPQYFAAINFAYRFSSTDHAKPVMAYVSRLQPEIQSVFARALAAQKKLSLLGADLAPFVREVGDLAASSAYMAVNK
jgi:hypothetical protein